MGENECLVSTPTDTDGTDGATTTTALSSEAEWLIDNVMRTRLSMSFVDFTTYRCSQFRFFLPTLIAT